MGFGRRVRGGDEWLCPLFPILRFFRGKGDVFVVKHVRRWALV